MVMEQDLHGITEKTQATTQVTDAAEWADRDRVWASEEAKVWPSNKAKAEAWNKAGEGALRTTAHRTTNKQTN